MGNVKIQDLGTVTPTDDDLVLISQQGKTRNTPVKNIRGVVDDLTSGGKNKALSAEQGKILASQLSDIVQVNLHKYIFLVINNDWSSAIESAIANNSNAEIYIPPSTTTYNFSRKIVLGRYNSLCVARGAIIKATTAMATFIEKHNEGSYTVSQYNRIYGGGVIDGNRLADDVISLGGYRHFKLEDLRVLNPLKRGIVPRYETGIFAVELMVNNIYIENDADTNRDTIGIYANSSDSHYKNIITVNMDIGIENIDGSNRFQLCHSWIYQTTRLDTSISFYDKNNGIWDTCYADTAPVGFRLEGASRVINCSVFNSSEFPMDSGSVAFYIPAWNRATKTIENCTIMGSSNSLVNKAFDCNFDETIKIRNIEYNEYVTELPPDTRNKTVATKVHTTTDNRYYKFATIKVPKKSMGNTIAGKFLIIDHNDSTASYRNINELEFVIKAFTSTTTFDFSNMKYTFTVKGSTLKDNVYVGYEDDGTYVIFKFYYDFGTRWDYLLVKIKDLIGGYGWVDGTNDTYIEDVETMLNRRIFIHKSNSFESTLPTNLCTVTNMIKPTIQYITAGTGVTLSSAGENLYSKADNGLVVVNFKVNKGTTTDGIASGDTLFNLPSGYRPPSNVYFAAGYTKYDGTVGAGYGVILASGDVRVYNTSNMKDATGTITFYV